MHLVQAVALYCHHRSHGELPKDFFRRALLTTHPDKGVPSAAGLPPFSDVYRARSWYTRCPRAFEREHQDIGPTTSSVSEAFRTSAYPPSQSPNHHPQERKGCSPPSQWCAWGGWGNWLIILLICSLMAAGTWMLSAPAPSRQCSDHSEPVPSQRFFPRNRTDTPSPRQKWRTHHQVYTDYTDL